MKTIIGIIAICHIIPAIAFFACFAFSKAGGDNFDFWDSYRIGWFGNLVIAVVVGFIFLIAWCFE